MKVKIIKILNNSVLLAKEQNRELLIRGKGVSFGLQTGSEFEIPKNVKVSFLNNNEKVQNVIFQVSDRILDIADQIFTIAQQSLQRKLSPTLILTLADHLDNCLKNQQANIEFAFDDSYTIQTAYLYPEEYKIGKSAIALIKKKLKKELPDYESGLIALHIVSAELSNGNLDKVQEIASLTKSCVVIIQQRFSIVLNKESVAFSRFVTHLRYLIERQTNYVDSKAQKDDIGKDLIQTLKEMYPQSYNAVVAIKDMLLSKRNWKLDDNEVVYLTIHIHRLVQTSSN